MNYLWNRVPPPYMLNWKRKWLPHYHPQDEECRGHHRGQGKVVRGSFTLQGQLVNRECYPSLNPWETSCHPRGPEGRLCPSLYKNRSWVITRLLQLPRASQIWN